PIALAEASVCLGHEFVDSANGEVTAWVEETLDVAMAALPPETRNAISLHQQPWPGPAVERRPEPGTTEGFIPTARDRVKAIDLDPDGEFALAAFVHRFTAGCVQALAAIGATAAYIEAERKAYSTFELALQVTGSTRPGSQ